MENEKARVPDDEPEDLAEEFLEFVKQRAGLLIEVGDRRYSFVHLTFQEYLTAAYFKTRTQGKGIAEIWRQLGSRSSEPRWHEVIRLFTAALDSDDAQEHVVANLLEAKKDANCAKLLGGFLLDGISPAEERELDIVSRLFHVAAAAGSATWTCPIRSRRQPPPLVLRQLETSHLAGQRAARQPLGLAPHNGS